MTYLRHDLAMHAAANLLGGHVDGCPKCDEIAAGTKFEVLDEVMKLMAPRGMGLGSVPWPVDLELLHAFLVRAACPIVCIGVNNDQENWHELCQQKADAAMEALDWAKGPMVSEVRVKRSDYPPYESEIHLLQDQP